MTNITGLLSQVHATTPLVHHITNYVTVNDCANVTLAIGGSPIMADSIQEAAAITAISSSLVVNIGTLNEQTIEAMISACQQANKLGIPVILDPVGAGASELRNQTIQQLLTKATINVLRGNISEIRYIAGLQSETKGVDASAADLESTDGVTVAQTTAAQLNAVVAITGATDIVSDGHRTVTIHNGHAMLAKVTGTGCMCSSLVGAYCGANPQQLLEATVAAIASMGIAGELAFEKAGALGTGSFHIALIDAISQLSETLLTDRGDIYGY